MIIQTLTAENKELRLQLIDTSKYHQWKPQEIVTWIINLDNDRFSKYKDGLLHHLNEEEIVGSDLNEINEVDLQRWEIKKFKDKKILLQKIKELTQQQQNDNDNADDDDIPAVINDEEGAESGGFHR